MGDYFMVNIFDSSEGVARKLILKNKCPFVIAKVRMLKDLKLFEIQTRVLECSKYNTVDRKNYFIVMQRFKITCI